MKLQAAMAEEMEGHGTSFIGGLMKAAGSLAGAAGALGGLAGKGQSILIPEPKETRMQSCASGSLWVFAFACGVRVRALPTGLCGREDWLRWMPIS